MSTVPAKHDDLDAVRAIATTLESFKADERERILRWVRERLGMASVASPAVSPSGALREPSGGAMPGPGPLPPLVALSATTDIRSFVDAKAPRSQNELAAAVAYYYRLVAPIGHRKEAITKDDLVEACRAAGRARPQRPDQLLVDAHKVGFLDRTTVRGAYELNAVGENLVALTLPSGGKPTTRPTKPVAPKRKPEKKRGRVKKR